MRQLRRIGGRSAVRKIDFQPNQKNKIKECGFYTKLKETQI